MLQESTVPDLMRRGNVSEGDVIGAFATGVVLGIIIGVLCSEVGRWTTS